MTKRTLVTLILIGGILVLCKPAIAQDVYSVSVDTTSLVGHPGGPFTAVFVLTDGSGTGDANNTVTITNVTFGGGTAMGLPSIFGGATGSLETQITLKDSVMPTLLLERFTPGSKLSFTVQVSLQDEDAVPIPDGLTFYIFDRSGVPLPTQSPASNYFLAIEQRSTGSRVETYASDPTRPPSAGQPLSIPAPTATFISGPIRSTITWAAPSSIVYGTSLGSAQLNAQASVPGSFTYSPTAGAVLDAGEYLLSVTFAPTDKTNYTSATATVGFNVTPAPIRATADSKTVPYGSTTAFTGTLTGVLNGDNINATYTSSASTTGAPGSYPITPVLADPDDRLQNYTVQLSNGTLTITKAAPVIAWAQPATDVNPSLAGQTTTFRAKLSSSTTGVPTGSVTFTDGATVMGTGFVDATGIATFTTSSLAVGAHPIVATYGGDGNYLGSVSTPIDQIVYTFAGTGVFVIGDLNAIDGNSVTFWGARWEKKNSLSGPKANAGFKGFANWTSANPPAVGGTWRADPGNSSKPPASIPTHMGIIVASTSVKRGSTISGDVVKIVVVKTHAGYEDDPGHAGTGTIIAILPGTGPVVRNDSALMFGVGLIDHGRQHGHFVFQASQRNGHDSARLEYWVNEPRFCRDDDDVDRDRDFDGGHDNDYGRDHHNASGHFEATAISDVTFSDDPAVRPGAGAGAPLSVDTVRFTGAGEWNGRSGYSFEATAGDRGEPGRNRDTFSIVIKDSRGTVVASTTSVIDGGNIQSIRIGR